MPIGHKGIFMGYNKHTTAYYYVYAPDIYTTIILSNIKFFKDLLGSSINNYQLQVELLDDLFEYTDNIFNKHIIWNKRGHSQEQRKNSSYLLATPTINSIRNKQASQLLDIVLGKNSSSSKRISRSPNIVQNNLIDKQVIFQLPAF